MDSNNSTMITLIVINLIINLIAVIDHFITRLKKSKCWLGEIEMDTEVKIKDDNKKPTQDNDNIKQLIDILNNNKSNNIDNKIENKI
jgi:hypothetical protein